MARKNTTQDICFYGNRNVGFDFLATLNGEAFEEASCEHEGETTADGNGAFCRFCGETLA